MDEKREVNKTINYLVKILWRHYEKDLIRCRTPLHNLYKNRR